jgi:hypothetical protein
MSVLVWICTIDFSADIYLGYMYIGRSNFITTGSLLRLVAFYLPLRADQAGQNQDHPEEVSGEVALSALARLSAPQFSNNRICSI